MFSHFGPRLIIRLRRDTTCAYTRLTVSVIFLFTTPTLIRAYLTIYKDFECLIVKCSKLC